MFILALKLLHILDEKQLIEVCPLAFQCGWTWMLQMPNWAIVKMEISLGMSWNYTSFVLLRFIYFLFCKENFSVSIFLFSFLQTNEEIRFCHRLGTSFNFRWLVHRGGLGISLHWGVHVGSEKKTFSNLMLRTEWRWELFPILCGNLFLQNLITCSNWMQEYKPCVERKTTVVFNKLRYVWWV